MDLLRSLPIGSYLEQPVTWLHKVDPRVKLAWLMTFLLAPILSNPWWRLGLAASLILLTIIAGVPFRVLRKQSGWLLLLCSFMFLFSSVAPDTLAVQHQPRISQFCPDVVTTPTADSPVQPSTPCKSDLPQPTDYKYVYFDQPKFFNLYPHLQHQSLSINYCSRRNYRRVRRSDESTTPVKITN